MPDDEYSPNLPTVPFNSAQAEEENFGTRAPAPAPAPFRPPPPRPISPAPPPPAPPPKPLAKPSVITPARLIIGGVALGGLGLLGYALSRKRGKQ